MSGEVSLLQDFLVATAERLPDKVGLVCGDERLSYREIDARSNALARRLAEVGVVRGDRVLVFAEAGAAAAVAFWAVLKADAVVSMIHSQTRAGKLSWILRDCRARVLIVGEGLIPVAVQAAREAADLEAMMIEGDVLPEPPRKGLAIRSLQQAMEGCLPGGNLPSRNLDIDLAAIVYTSGSTGEPKGVMLTHRNMITAAVSVSTYLQTSEADVILGVLPLSFDYGLYQMIMAFRLGARLILERGFTWPAAVLDRMAAEGVTVFPGVPTIFSMLLAMRSIRDRDLSFVRTVTNTAAALSERQIHELRVLFPGARIYSMYGLTECKRCTYLPPEDLDRKPNSVGVAIPGTELWLVDEEGRRLGPGKVGQLVIRGSTVMRGYWENPEETARKLRPGPLPGELVLYTGDLCRLDEDGYLYFVGRMDDILKSRGEKVAPREVEGALVDIPGVREAAVIGVDDPVLGQAIKAFVILADGAELTPRQILAACRLRLEDYMMPKYVEIVSDLPRTTTGKILKTNLR